MRSCEGDNCARRAIVVMEDMSTNVRGHYCRNCVQAFADCVAQEGQYRDSVAATIQIANAMMAMPGMRDLPVCTNESHVFPPQGNACKRCGWKVR